MKTSVILALAGSATAFAPRSVSWPSVAVNGYVPDGLSASDWAARQKKEKAAKVQNKAKYPKGAPQVLGVKEYLEKLQAKQAFDDWRKKGGKPPNNNEEGRSANHWF